MFEYKLDENNIATLTINMESLPTNVWNNESIQAFSDSLDKLLFEPELSGIVVCSARKDFLAGADLKAIQPLDNIEKNMKTLGQLVKSFRRLETSGVPVVAAIAGSALGGGYELCLACHYRVAIDDNKIKIGLPESQLGLLPGAGGTQRLPRMIGIQAALQFMVEGKQVHPHKALQMGLINDLAKGEQELISKAKNWVRHNTHTGEAIQPWDHKKFKYPGGGVQSPGAYTTFMAGTALLRKKTAGNYPAAQAIMSAVYEGCQVPFDQALKIEARYFKKCLKSSVAKNTVRTMFTSLNEINKGIARPKNFPPTDFNKVGILGAGMMGAGIAYAAANAGIEVVLKDTSLEFAQKGKAYSEKVLAKLMEKGRVNAEKIKKTLDLIHPTTEANDLRGCDLIIEAVTEDRNIKGVVLKEAEEQVGPKAIMASNTSTLPITGLSEYCERRDQFIGLHFFSPVDKMPLVEIILGQQTSQETLAKAFDFVRKLKKTPIVVNDGRGFYTSRVFSSYIHAGTTCLKEGIAPPLIENAGKMAGMPVGPLAVADEISIDLIYHVLKQEEEDTGKTNNSPSAQVAKLFVEEFKRLGRKSQKGFYEYPDKGKSIYGPIWLSTSL